MISQKLFEDYFKAVFETLYEIDVRLDAVFKASSLKESLEGKDNNSFINGFMGERSSYASKVPKLLINITSKDIGGLPFANDTVLMYTREKLFFRIYTNNDLQILKRNLRLGIRRKQLLGKWNLFLDDSSIRPAVSLEGYSTLTGYIFYGVYEGTAGTVRPIDTVDLHLKDK